MLDPINLPKSLVEKIAYTLHEHHCLHLGQPVPWTSLTAQYQNYWLGLATAALMVHCNDLSYEEYVPYKEQIEVNYVYNG